MTTGSWTAGSPVFAPLKVGSVDYAEKTWSGGNGKTETWSGGNRIKWNNYTMYNRERHNTAVKASWGDYVHWPVYVQDHVGATVENIVGWSANDELRLLSKLAEQVRGHSFDLGINLAESRESYKTILGNLQSIGAALVNFKHGRIGNGLRYLGVTGRRARGVTRRLNALDVSGRWLEMQYAWLPMVSQSFEAAKALEALTGPRVFRFVTSIGTKRGSYNASTTPIYSSTAWLSYSVRIYTELSENIGVGRSLGLVDPVQIAWEVVPYSFVVDWFIPIGTYLSVWQTIPALNGRFLTVRRYGNKGPSKVNVIDSSGENWRYGLARGRERIFRISRTVSTSLAVPKPTFNSVPKALSPKRLLNAVALIHQALK